MSYSSKPGPDQECCVQLYFAPQPPSKLYTIRHISTSDLTKAFSEDTVEILRRQMKVPIHHIGPLDAWMTHGCIVVGHGEVLVASLMLGRSGYAYITNMGAGYAITLYPLSESAAESFPKPPPVGEDTYASNGFILPPGQPTRISRGERISAIGPPGSNDSIDFAIRYRPPPFDQLYDPIGRMERLPVNLRALEGHDPFLIGDHGYEEWCISFAEHYRVSSLYDSLMDGDWEMDEIWRERTHADDGLGLARHFDKLTTTSAEDTPRPTPSSTPARPIKPLPTSSGKRAARINKKNEGE